MSETKRFICIGCPIGCPLHLEHKGKTIIKVSGNECSRGAKYAIQEFTDPRRNVSTTVAVSGALWNRLPVKVSGAVPKDRVMEVVREIHGLKAEAPIRLGQILMRDLLGEEGLNVVACRSMARVASHK